jgi:hypothetical protein
VVVRPEVSHLQWTDFRTVPDTVESGAAAARAALPQIRASLGLPATETVG